MKNQFNSITDHVALLRYLYILSLPLARVFVRYDIKPNTITSISNALALFAFYFLFSNQVFLFIFLWILAEIFDICDGTVARIQGQTSETGAFYDHFSDQVKIFLLFVCMSFYYGDNTITYLSFIGAGIFLLAIDLGKRNEILILKYDYLKNSIDNSDLSLNFFRHVYNHIFIISGHTMIALSFLAINQKVAFYGLILFLLVSFKNFLGSARAHIRALQLLKNLNK